MISIVIVEDQILFRDSLVALINGQENMRVTGVCSHTNEALALCQTLSPALVLMDVVTGGSPNGIAVAAQILQALPEVKTVVMTAVPEISFINAAQMAGVHSFIYKTVDSVHLLYVIRSTMKGQGIYPGPTAGASFKINFTDTQLTIIRLVCQGKSRSEIAQVLSTSEGSVKASITTILNKTGFNSIMKFAVYAVANGFILPNKIE